MLNPIKRVWVPKTPLSTAAPGTSAANMPAAAPAVSAPVAPTVMVADAARVDLVEATPSKRGILFEEVPEPEVSEKFSDSIWAEFNSVLPQPHLQK